MLALRGQRPFSLDAKMDSLDAYLPPGHSLCEIRLLAVEKPERFRDVFPGLMRVAAGYGITRGYTLAVISGILKQRRLYEHIGFVAFGPEVGTAEARFQPMLLTLDAYRERFERANR